MQFPIRIVHNTGSRPVYNASLRCLQNVQCQLTIVGVLEFAFSLFHANSCLFGWQTCTAADGFSQLFLSPSLIFRDGDDQLGRS